MAKREFIDKTHLLAEIKKLQKSPWYNRGENDMAVARAFYNERKEAVEVVRDLCVNDEPTITEQEIVKPYLNRLKQKMQERDNDNSGYPYTAVDKGYHLAYTHLCKEIDNLLSEQEGQ